MSQYQNNATEATHPGEFISEILEERSLSQATLSKKMGVSQKHLSNLINGKSSITTDMAKKLSLVFATSVDFWLNLQKMYDAIKARLSLEE